MTSYAPPLSLPPIFNPSLFSGETTAVVDSSAPPGDIYFQYPLPQGPITFVSSGNEVEIGAQKLSLLRDVGIVPNGVEMSALGIAYDSGVSPVQAVTWDNLAKKVAAVQALSQAPDATTLAVNNTISIQDGETDGSPTSYISISSGITNEIISTTDLLLEAPNIDISGQASFQLPPHIPTPILGNDAASKGYVDSLVGQYAGGFNLFDIFFHQKQNCAFERTSSFWHFLEWQPLWFSDSMQGQSLG